MCDHLLLERTALVLRRGGELPHDGGCLGHYAGLHRGLLQGFGRENRHRDPHTGGYQVPCPLVAERRRVRTHLGLLDHPGQLNAHRHQPGFAQQSELSAFTAYSDQRSVSACSAGFSGKSPKKVILPIKFLI